MNLFKKYVDTFTHTADWARRASSRPQWVDQLRPSLLLQDTTKPQRWPHLVLHLYPSREEQVHACAENNLLSVSTVLYNDGQYSLLQSGFWSNGGQPGIEMHQSLSCVLFNKCLNHSHLYLAFSVLKLFTRMSVNFSVMRSSCNWLNQPSFKQNHLSEEIWHWHQVYQKKKLSDKQKIVCKFWIPMQHFTFKMLIK